MRSPNLLALVAAGAVLVTSLVQPRTAHAAATHPPHSRAHAIPRAHDGDRSHLRGGARASSRAHAGNRSHLRGGAHAGRGAHDGGDRSHLRRSGAHDERGHSHSTTHRGTAKPARTSPEAAPQSRVQRALARLAHRVNTSDRDALRMAFRAYYNYRAAHPDQVRKPYLYFVDYGLDAETPRGYLFDMSALRVVEGPFQVAHGRGSAARGGVPRRFSNRHGSGATSLGLFLAQESYRMVGHAEGRRYTSLALRLRGLSGRFNAQARERGVVVHGAPYVTHDGAGRSLGCPAVSAARARTLIPRIREGGLVFLYSPLDRTWKAQDPWAGRDRG